MSKPQEIADDELRDYRKIEIGKPFFILHKDPKKQDITVWRTKHYHDGNIGLQIYFHVEDFWCNPPTDTQMEYNATKAIEKYGIAYLPDGDAYIEGYKNSPVMERATYRQEYAEKFFNNRIAQLTKETQP